MKENVFGREDSTRDLLLSKLRNGWRGSHTATLELISQIAISLDAHLTITTGQQSPTIEFVLDLSHIRLQGMNEVHCLALCADTHAMDEEIRGFLVRRYAVGRILFTFCLVTEVENRARSLTASIRCILFTVDRTCELLRHPDAKAFLKSILINALPRLSLIAYTIHAPVEPNMFFGREEELNRIFHESAASFAIAGPPGLGKTSLLRQYQKRLITSRDPRAQCRFYLNFLECENKSPDDIARFIAFKVNPTRRGYNVKADVVPDAAPGNRRTDELDGGGRAPERFRTDSDVRVDGLKRFLLREQRKYGQSLELLLDEVDEVCRSPVFESLGDCARDGICRLVLCGRSELLNMMQQAGSPLRRRLRLIQLHPLTEGEARQLIFEPLSDLGIRIEEEEAFVARINALTGRFPHLLQFYGRKLAERALQKHSDLLTLKHVEEVRWDHETALFFTTALEGIKDLTLKRVALLLLRYRPHTINPYVVMRLAQSKGVPLTEQNASAACNALVIENVLSWYEGEYFLANESLAEYAERGQLFEFLFRRTSATR